MLTNDYGAGTIVMLNVPNNPSDLYQLPGPVLSQIRRFASGQLPVRLVDADSRVALFEYDNGGFSVESYRDTPTTVTVEVARGRHLQELPSGAMISQAPPPPGALTPTVVSDTGTAPEHAGAAATLAPPAPARFSITLPAHSFRAYRVQQ